MSRGYKICPEQLRGLPDSYLLRKDTADASTDNIFSVAAGEGHKPISILHLILEEMCNPTKYPTGKFGLITEKKTNPTICKYFNQRTLDAGGRFSRDIISYNVTCSRKMDR